MCVGYRFVDIEGVPTYIFEISDNKGNITDQPADKALKQTFSKEWADIQEAEAQKEDKEEEKQGSSVPKKGTVSGGYKFLGGNPNDQKNWKKV